MLIFDGAVDGLVICSIGTTGAIRSARNFITENVSIQLIEYIYFYGQYTFDM